MVCTHQSQRAEGRCGTAWGAAIQCGDAASPFRISRAPPGLVSSLPATGGCTDALPAHDDGHALGMFPGRQLPRYKPVQCVYRAGASAAPKVQCAMLAEMPGLLGVSTQSQHSLSAQQRHAHGCWVPLQTSAPGAMQRA